MFTIKKNFCLKFLAITERFKKLPNFFNFRKTQTFLLISNDVNYHARLLQVFNEFVLFCILHQSFKFISYIKLNCYVLDKSLKYL